MQNDNGTGVLWENAISHAENFVYAGYSDWRLPDAKELQGLIDYTRSPSTSNSAAINTLFNCAPITNEAGIADYGFYWSSTTFCSQSPSNGASACYLSFGRAMGYMAVHGGWIDVHGAGAQRSDPKTGDPANYPFGFGPQGDAIRIYNYVRLVRDAGITTGLNEINSEDKLNIYPNPFSDKINLANSTGNELYDLLNSMGQLIWSGMKIEQQDFSALTSGIYFLKVKDQYFTQAIKLIKQ